MADELDVAEGTIVGRSVGSPDVDDLDPAAALTVLGTVAVIILTQAEYDGITPDPDTLYVIVG